MRRALVLLVIVGLAAACDSSPPAAQPPSSPGSSASPALPGVPGIEAEAVRLRTDEAVGGRIQVRVTDTGHEEFTVTAVALDSPGFTSLPPTALTAEFAPGRVLDLPTPYGEPVCDAEPLPAAARLTVVRPGGAAEDVRVPMSGDVLQLVHDEECAVRAVEDVVEVTVTGLFPHGEALWGSLTLTRRSGDEQVTATALDRSVLIDVVAARLPLVLEGEQRSATTTVSFTPASCHPHVLSETKKPYVFPLTVEVGGADAVPVDLPLDDALRAQLAGLVQRVCA